MDVHGIPGKLYYFSQERITFAEAKATCEYNLGKLFEPTNEIINNIIALHSSNSNPQIVNPWIGIHRLHDEGRTIYASTGTTVDWTNWDIHEPNNENDGEDCVHLYNQRKDTACHKLDIGYVIINNGKCEDSEFNIEECFWEGGDCCEQMGNPPSCTCNYELIDNEKCDDETNTEECKWDGGDCCDLDGTKCLEPFRWNDDNCDEYRRFICEKEKTG